VRDDKGFRMLDLTAARLCRSEKITWTEHDPGQSDHVAAGLFDDVAAELLIRREDDGRSLRHAATMRSALLECR